MKLGMSAWRPIETTPVATFPDDDKISPSTYAQLMSDGYSAIMAYVRSGSKAGGVALDDITEERWRRLTVASYYIDEFIDSAEDTEYAHSLYEKGLTAALDGHDVSQLAHEWSEGLALNPLLEPSIVALQNSVTNITAEQRQNLHHDASIINSAAVEKSLAADIDTYIDILRAESDAMTDLYDNTATSTVTEQSHYPRFSRTYHQIMRVAVFGDSAVDLKDDYDQGITQVPPTPRNIGKLAMQAITPALQAAKQPLTYSMLLQVKPALKPSA